MKTSHLLSVVLATSSITSAWPWPSSVDDLKSLSGLDHVLSRRQEGGNNNDDTPQPSATPAPSITPTARQTRPPNSDDATSVRPTGTRGATSGSRSAEPTGQTTEQTSADTGAWPGGVNMIKPNTQFGGSQYYAISSGVESTVTLVWNYTKVVKTPAHIDVVATMASSSGGTNPTAYTLSSNMSFDATQTFEWDTGKWASKSNMPNGIYTLNIFDADAPGGATAIPKAGQLAPFSQYMFGVYSPLPYVVAEPTMQCATCNAAGGKMDKLAWGTLLGTTSIAIGTMTWFTGLAGIW